MAGKIVFKGKVPSGQEIIIKYPVKEDLQAMWEYINQLSKERTFIRYQGEEISLDQEEKFLQSQLEKIAKNMAVFLLAFCGEKLVGIAGMEMKDRVEKHIGGFHISIAKDFRGAGIGSKLMEAILEEAKRKLPQLEIIILSVFANNHSARQMYQKFGFLEYGKLPKGIKLEKDYIDHVYMYKIVR